MNDSDIRRLGVAVIESETRALQSLVDRIDSRFVEACQHMLSCQGRIVVTGMGKSGHIGNKIAATLASTGSPAFFMHPGEASHGDLGMITPKDVVMALSNSGETDEILTILPLIKRLGTPLITLTGNPNSTLSRASTVNIDVGIEEEACPLGLAPTSSTTAALAMGDALAISLLEYRGFTAEDFALSHPGGRLGRRLLLLIDDVMHKGDRLPTVPSSALMSDAVIEITRKGLGMTAIVDDDNKLLGVLTDGDLRRLLDQELHLHDTQVSDVMTRDCTTMQPHSLAAEALQIMEKKAINGLLVVDEDRTLLGALNMHDLLRAGVV